MSNTNKLLIDTLNSISPYLLLAVHLKSGDILLGGIFHIPHVFEGFPLAFNTSDGDIFNHSAIATIPYAAIASIELIQFESTAYAGIFPMRYPNPLATILYNHNSSVATANSIEIGHYTERAFSPNAIPEDGIRLSDWFTLYADYKELIFDQPTPTAVSVATPLFSVSRTFNEPNSTSDIAQKLKAIKAQYHDITVPTSEGTPLVGFNAVFQRPLEGYDDIEGEPCYVWKALIVRESTVLTRLIAMKRARLKFPLDFVQHLSSEFTFLAEPLPFPLTDSQGTSHTVVYLARAVAYVPNDKALLKL